MSKMRIIMTALLMGTSLLWTPVYGEPTENEQQHEDETPGIEEVAPQDNLPEAEETQPEGAKDTGTARKRGRAAKDKDSGSPLSLFAFILGLAGAGLGGYGFYKLGKLREDIAKKEENNKKFILNLKGMVDDQKKELVTALMRLERVQADILKIQTGQAANKAHYATSNLQCINIDGAEDEPSHTGMPVAERQPVRESVKLFCGVPQGGMFVNANAHRSRQSLYTIIDNGGPTCQYYFIDDQSSAMVAARSTSDFLDPACVIDGNQNPNFTKVHTKIPGTVKRTPAGWVINSKAVVELV